MSAGCLVIELLDVPESVPDHYRNPSGSVYLDLLSEDNESFTEIRQISDLTVDNAINIDDALDVAVPFTALNELSLMPYVDAHVFGQKTKALRCRVWNGGLVDKYNFLFVTTGSDPEIAFNVTLTNRLDHPFVLMQDCKLCDVFNQDDVFLLTKENVEANWATNSIFSGWEDGDDP